MIIDITRCNYAPGYLPKATQGFFNPFFATANVAFRREALRETGGFDPNCQTGEDVDISIRVSRAGWELWYEPEAVVNHQDPHTFRQLLRQWFGYGLGHAYVYKKHLGRPRLQAYWPGDSKSADSRPYGARCVLDLPFPFYGVAFLSGYHLFHLALLVLVIGLIAHSTVFAIVASAVALAAGLNYASIRFDLRRPLYSLAMLGLRYAGDTAFVTGALLGGLRERALFLEATRTR
jgi:cellulose synthase/poly-beta-1,6-N-acetylglucosamine synthase-like glycosyltransferase